MSSPVGDDGDAYIFDPTSCPNVGFGEQSEEVEATTKGYKDLTPASPPSQVAFKRTFSSPRSPIQRAYEAADQSRKTQPTKKLEHARLTIMAKNARKDLQQRVASLASLVSSPKAPHPLPPVAPPPSPRSLTSLEEESLSSPSPRSPVFSEESSPLASPGSFASLEKSPPPSPRTPITRLEAIASLYEAAERVRPGMEEFHEELRNIERLESGNFGKLPPELDPKYQSAPLPDETAVGRQAAGTFAKAVVEFASSLI